MPCPTCGCTCGELMNFSIVGDNRILVVDVDGDKAARIGALIDRLRPMVDNLASMRDRVEEVRAHVDDFAESVKNFELAADRDEKPFHQRLNRKPWERR